MASRRIVKVTASVIVVGVLALLLEGAAQMAYVFREKIMSVPLLSPVLDVSKHLDPYEMRSDKGGYHWVLRPGYMASANQLTSIKSQQGKSANGTLDDSSDALLHEQTDGLKINQNGFRGPELEQSNTRPRILMIGDSVTFGLARATYPRAAESMLIAQGSHVAVVNGGVEGYAIRNALLEKERYVEVRPSVITIFLGWNDLYARDPLGDSWESKFKTIWFIRKSSETIRMLFGDVSSISSSRRPFISTPGDVASDISAVITKCRRQCRFEFMETLSDLVSYFADRGVQVSMMTLPGLFMSDELPRTRALDIGHLPSYTNDPNRFAAYVEVYNQRLREFADLHGHSLIDLERWADTLPQPREQWFVDTVHLNANGLIRLGKFIAEELSLSRLVSESDDQR